jgi:hypothetical protein
MWIERGVLRVWPWSYWGLWIREIPESCRGRQDVLGRAALFSPDKLCEWRSVNALSQGAPRSR